MNSKNLKWISQLTIRIILTDDCLLFMLLTLFHQLNLLLWARFLGAILGVFLVWPVVVRSIFKSVFRPLVILMLILLIVGMRVGNCGIYNIKFWNFFPFSWLISVPIALLWVVSVLKIDSWLVLVIIMWLVIALMVVLVGGPRWAVKMVMVPGHIFVVLMCSWVDIITFLSVPHGKINWKLLILNNILTKIYKSYPNYPSYTNKCLISIQIYT